MRIFILEDDPNRMSWFRKKFSDCEIDTGIFVFTVAHISGQYGKGVLGRFSPLFDFQ